MSSQVVKELFRSKDPIMSVMGLKNFEFDEALKKIGQSIQHPAGKSLLLEKNLLPKSYANIRNTRQTYFTDNLEGEIAWMLKILIINKDELSFFIDKEKEFQEQLLLNNYVNTFNIISEINEKICFSYWAMENIFSLKDKSEDSKENWEFLKEINNSVNNNLTLLFAEFFSKKAEKEVSTLQFKRELENIINGLNERDTETFIFKLGSIYFNNFKYVEALTFIESTSSIIDQYLFLMDLLLYLHYEKKHHSLIVKVLNELIKNGFKDPRIQRLLELTSVNIPIHDFNTKILELFDIYSLGNYDKALSEVKKLLKEEPACIELYEVYIKSLIELELGFVETQISQNVDDILAALYILYTKEKSFYDAEETLMKSYLSFSKVNFFKQLISLTLSLTGSELNNGFINKSYYVYSKYSNPNLLMGDNIDKGLYFPENFLSYYLSLKINYFIGVGNIEKLEELHLQIPTNKLAIYKARVGYNYQDKFDLNLLRDLSSNLALNILFEQEILTYWFKYYLNNNYIGELVGLLVNAYFKNPFLLKTLRIDSLINKIISEDYILEKTDINLPIIFYIANSEDYFQFASLDVYLHSLNIEKPSELLTSQEYPEINKKVFLLEKICNLNVLNNFYLVFENDKDVLDERVNILRILISINDRNSDKYFEEIAVLSRKKKVDSTIQNYNDGKISLNFERIKEENIQSLETSFNRFIKLRDYSEKNELKVIEGDVLIKRILNEFINREDNFQDASFVAFKAIFLEMVNVFLFSKEHGLDGDLSTRIRHGVLENKLRIVFLNNNIISTKNNDVYIDIEYWRNMCETLSYISEISNSIQDSLKSFSKKIDDLILKIKNEYIQIISYKHNSKEKALFNYTFTEEYLWIVYKSIKDEVSDYSEFQNISFDILKSHTESLLENISAIIKNELINDFIELINSFELEIDSIPHIGGEVLYELKQKIKFAKTQIENELLEVSKWFKLTSFFDIYTLDIETVILTALEIINNDIDIKINPKLILPEDNFLVEKGYSYIEIFKILIENAVKHSKVNISDLNLEIIMNEPVLIEKGNDKDIESIIQFSISNKINKEVSENCNMEFISNNWNSSLINVNVEGGSGYQKINRILKHGNKVNSKISFDITEKFKVNFTIHSNYKYIENEN